MIKRQNELNLPKPVMVLLLVLFVIVDAALGYVFLREFPVSEKLQCSKASNLCTFASRTIIGGKHKVKVADYDNVTGAESVRTSVRVCSSKSHSCHNESRYNISLQLKDGQMTEAIFLTGGSNYGNNKRCIEYLNGAFENRKEKIWLKRCI
jgi:hypothetical protein